MAQSGAKNLFEELAELQNTAPKDIDPEQFDDQAKLIEDSSIRNYQPVERSKIRAQIGIEDPKYAGKRVSRSDLYEQDEESESSDGDLDDNLEKVLGIGGGESSEEDEDDEESMDQGSDEDDEDSPSLDAGPESTTALAQQMQKEFERLQQKKSKQDEKSQQGTNHKGEHTRNQLILWEQLVELRIRLQKALIAVNQLPDPQITEKMGSDSAYHTTIEPVKNEVAQLVDTMMRLQSHLLEQNPQTMTYRKSRKRKQDDLTIEALEEHVSFQHESCTEFFSKTAEKWHTKTKIAAGKAGKNFKALDKGIMDQVDGVLEDKQRLLSRTRTPRAQYQKIGKNSTTDENNSEVKEDPEMFDDSDFYHELLRDLISRKAANLDSADPTEMGKHWVEMNRLRSKMRKKVDTKASKGRKLRYNVHDKLVNFMPQIDHHYPMRDGAREELFQSLFGQKREQSKGNNNNITNNKPLMAGDFVIMRSQHRT